MTIRRIVQLVCNGCGVVYQPTRTDLDGKQQQREAQMAGWVLQQSRPHGAVIHEDLCPECARR